MRILGLSLCSVLFLLAACSSDTTDDGTVFICGKSGDAKSLDHANVTDGESVMVCTNIFDTLVTFKTGSVELRPWVAESWETSEDGKTWTFHIRAGLKFHDGTPLDSNAVKFSFDRQMDKSHPARRQGDVFASFHSVFSALQAVEVVDALTVRFTLSKPFAPFLSTLALYCVAIVAPSGFEDGNDFAVNPIGSGPFRFVEWKEDEYIRLHANPDHFAGAPNIKTLIFKPVKHAQTRLKELESGSLHGMDNPDLVDVKRLGDDSSVNVLRSPGINVCYLAMNTQKKPFTDKRVRQAVAFAINKERLIQAAYAGIGEPAVSMCPVTMKGHLAMEDRKPDIAKAKKLLADAGFPNGFETVLWYPVIQRAYLPDSSSTAIQIQQDLKAIGITAKLKKVEWTAYLAATGNGAHEMCILGWMCDYGDPDDYLNTLLHKDNANPPGSQNRSFYRDDKYSALISRARFTTEWSERVTMYAEAQRMLFEDVPCVPLVTVPDFRVLAKGVSGYTIYPAGGEYFREVKIDR